MRQAAFPRRVLHGLGTVLACLLVAAAGGVLIELIQAGLVIRRQGYVELGFRHLIWRAALDASLRGFVVGSLTGLVALVAFALARAAGLPPRAGLPSAAIRFLRAGHNVQLTCLILCILALGALAAIALLRGEVGSFDCLGVVALAGIGCALTAFASWALRTAEASDREHGARILGLVAAALFFAVTAFIWLGKSPAGFSLRGMLLRGAILLLLAAWLGFLLRRRMAHPSQVGFPEHLALVLAVFLAGAPVLLAALAAWLGGPSLLAGRPMNVVLIGIDTLRADHTSLDGLVEGGRDLTPSLRGLAERGTRFDAAESQSSWTLPAFASILTGEYPGEHGAFSLMGTLRPGEVCLAEVLREAGYATRAAVSNQVIGRSRGFAQGFEEYDESSVALIDLASSRRVTETALAMLDDDLPQPFLLFAHYFDPHFPYVDHEDLEYADGYEGWINPDVRFRDLLTRRHRIQPADLQHIKNLYAEEVANTDREVGRLLEGLRSRGLEEETLIVVVSDHGEAFLEHGDVGHANGLYQEEIHVPLIFAGPGVPEGEVVSTPVETRAIFGTVLDVLDVDFEPRARAESLLHELLRSPDAALKEIAYSSLTMHPELAPEQGFPMASLRKGSWTLIWDFARRRHSLFDLERDPGQHRDLSSGNPARVQELAPLLDDWIRAMSEGPGEGPRSEPSEAERRALEQLGYGG